MEKAASLALDCLDKRICNYCANNRSGQNREKKILALNKRNKSQFTTIGEGSEKTTDGLTNASFLSVFLDKTHTDVGLYIFKQNCYGSFI